MESRIVIVVYRPHAGKYRELETVISKHWHILEEQGLVTERRPMVMRSSDGAFIEVFEWRSPVAIKSAHENPAVLALWDEFASICDYERPANVKEFGELFSEFTPLS